MIYKKEKKDCITFFYYLLIFLYICLRIIIVYFSKKDYFPIIEILLKVRQIFAKNSCITFLFSYQFFCLYLNNTILYYSSLLAYI